MLVVVPVSSHDRGLVNAFCEVVNFLGPYQESHELLVVSRPSDIQYAKEVYKRISLSFKTRSIHTFEEDGPLGWPSGPNFYWHESIRYLEKIKNIRPWLWMELDMTPIEVGWLDTLEKEYIETDKNFLGILQTIPRGTHFVGAGIYPGNFYSDYHSWKTVTDSAIAFDILCELEIVKDAKQSEYFEHKFRTSYYKCTNRGLQGIVTDEALWVYPEFSRPIKKSTVLVHGCVDSSLAHIILNKPTELFEKAYNELSKKLR
jgi:hypothetical protein